MAMADPAREKRAKEIFEREGDKALTWNPPGAAQTPGADAVTAVDEEAKERYRELAGKELAAEGRS